MRSSADRARHSRATVGGVSTEQPAWRDFLTLDDRALLAQCAFDRFRASGPGGQKRNVTDSAVRLRHQPSGVSAESNESRSQHENRARALRRLRRAMAIGRARPPPSTGTRGRRNWTRCERRTVASRWAGATRASCPPLQRPSTCLRRPGGGSAMRLGRPVSRRRPSGGCWSKTPPCGGRPTRADAPTTCRRCAPGSTRQRRSNGRDSIGTILPPRYSQISTNPVARSPLAFQSRGEAAPS